MGPFIMAWLVGEGIIIYRSVKKTHAPPGPGQLILSSGVFVLLALVAESERARGIATLAAWGFDIAAFLNLFPPVTGPATGDVSATAQGGLAGQATGNIGGTIAGGVGKQLIPGPWPPTSRIPDNELFPGDVRTGSLS